MSPVNRWSRRAGIISALLLCTSCSDGPAPLRLEKTEMQLKGRSIVVELARSPEEQMRGLMFRRSLGADHGMLFMYDSPRVMSFWMKNTRIPLSIAFIDGSGRIVQIEPMEPYDAVTRHVSQQPAMYALEMNRGWFEKNGVGVGDRMEIPHPHNRGGSRSTR